jgi:hypothetical protein
VLWGKAKNAVAAAKAIGTKKEEDPDKEEEEKEITVDVKKHSVCISFITMDDVGYHLNTLKLFPYIKFTQQKPELFRSQIQWKRNWLLQETP